MLFLMTHEKGRRKTERIVQFMSPVSFSKFQQTLKKRGIIKKKRKTGETRKNRKEPKKPKKPENETLSPTHHYHQTRNIFSRL